MRIIDIPFLKGLTHGFLCLGLFSVLVACGRVDGEGRALADYENEATEALIRKVIHELPDLNPGVPKSYSLTVGEIIKGRDFSSVSVPFIKRFDDLKLRIVSAEVLVMLPPDRVAADPDLRVPVYLVQVRRMNQTATSEWEFELGWSYKKKFERNKWKVKQKEDGSFAVEKGPLIEGN